MEKSASPLVVVDDQRPGAKAEGFVTYFFLNNVPPHLPARTNFAAVELNIFCFFSAQVDKVNDANNPRNNNESNHDFMKLNDSLA